MVRLHDGDSTLLRSLERGPLLEERVERLLLHARESGMDSVKIEQLQARGIKPRGNKLHKAFQYFVAQVAVFLALGAQPIPVQYKRLGASKCSRGEVPAIGR